MSTGEISSPRLFPARRAKPRAAASAVPARHALLALCLIAVCVPLLAVEFPPLFDYPNHLARAHVIKHQANAASFGAHYEMAGFLVPNVLADLLTLGFMTFAGAPQAGQLLTVAIAGATVSGAYALNRAATGRWSAWALLATALVFNEMFVWGFLNYLLGLALLLWALAAWLALRRRPRALQVAVGAVFALLLFLSHLVALGLFAVAVALLEIRCAWRCRAAGPAAAAGRLATAAVPFVLPTILFVWASPSGGLAVNPLFDFSAWGKLSPFTRLLASGSPVLDAATLAVVVGLVLFGLAARRVVFDRGLGLVAVGFLALVLALPYSALGSFFLDSRIAIAAALIAVVALRPVGARRWERPVALAILAVVSVRSAVLAQEWRGLESAYQPVLAALRDLPEGSLLVAGSAAEFELGDWLQTRRQWPPREHVATYATIKAGVLVPNVFARRGQNPLVFAPTLPEMEPLGRNPIARLGRDEDLRALAGQAARVAARRDEVAPPLAGVFIIAHYVACRDWPADLPVRRVVCDDDFSLVEVGARFRPTRVTGVEAHPEWVP